VLDVVVHRQDEHAGRRVVRDEMLEGFAAVHHRHVEIEHGDVGRLVLDQLECFLAIRCLADDADVRHAAEERPQSGPHDEMIVHDDDPDGIGRCAG
jgi:hypothetical protein